MADTKFIDFNVLKRAYEILRNIINNNKKNTDANINDVSTRADAALAATATLASDAEKYATKEQLEQHKQLADSIYATKDELQSGIGGVVSFQFTIVDELPATGISQIVYLMLNDASSGDNIYNEYLWIEESNKYERIGSMDVDLSDYLTKSDASSTYVTKDKLVAELLNKSNTGHTHNYAGSSSEGGVAISADKLTKSAGSSNNPVYFLNGVPVAIDYSVNKTVPADAKFTDTTYQQANENTLGLVRLYVSNGQNSDGTMTQKAITDAINASISDGTSGSAVNDSDGNPINTTYLKKTTAESTYLSKTDASSTYLTKTDASSTYLGKTATAAKATADASGNNIADTYLTKTDASNTYLSKSETAASATKLANARTIQISGSVNGSASFDGTGDINIKTTVQYGEEAPTELENGTLFCVIES